MTAETTRDDALRELAGIASKGHPYEFLTREFSRDRVLRELAGIELPRPKRIDLTRALNRSLKKAKKKLEDGKLSSDRRERYEYMLKVKTC